MAHHTAREARDVAGLPAGTGLERRLNTEDYERDAGPELDGPEGGKCRDRRAKAGSSGQRMGLKTQRGDREGGAR